jgi:hypothetical protein
MGLFSSKKKEQSVRPELPPLKFPDLPQEGFSEKKPTLITPEEATAIKRAVSSVPRAPSREEIYKEAPSIMGQPEKPLFVKVEKYKEVMNTINHLKEKLKDTTAILNELNRIKDEEEHEINSWQKDLDEIKEKLMTIDQALFES